MNRRITADAMKAETRLRSLARAKEVAVATIGARWDERRAAFIASLPDDVLPVLIAAGVVETEEKSSAEAGK